MLLPKVPDQAAYYSRQLYLFNFAIVQGSSRSPLKQDNVFLYLWTENLRPKGCNEIASAVHHRLVNTVFKSNVSKIRFVCDGCGGQNKNQAMMGMISYWLHNQAPQHIREIELIYPVPGHSYIPPDRVFAQLEKRVRSKETILHVSDYFEMYKDHGTLIKHALNDCPIRNWKEASAKTFKAPGQWHFKFNLSKRFYIKRTSANTSITMRGEYTYKSDMGVAKSVLKKNNRIESMVLPDILNEKPTIKPEKLADVNKLLIKHCGENWREDISMIFYKSIIDNEEETYEHEEELCQEQENECVLRI